MLLTLLLSLSLGGCDKGGAHRPLGKKVEKSSLSDAQVVRTVWDIVDKPAGVVDAGVEPDEGPLKASTVDVRVVEALDVVLPDDDGGIQAHLAVQTSIVEKTSRRVEEIKQDAAAIIKLLKARRAMPKEEYRKWKNSRAKLLNRLEKDRQQKPLRQPPARETPMRHRRQPPEKEPRP